MTTSFDPERDLTITRLVRAPREKVWRAWTDPERFARWWIPAPALCRVAEMDLRPGGGLRTEMSENGGAFGPHLDACFLAVEPMQKLVFTNALTGGWRPATNPFMTAVITFAEHADGTDYVARVLHKDNATQAMHTELGFYDGWGTVAAQLAALVEAEAD